MDRQYLWRLSKPGHRVHILDFKTARAYCQVENCGGKPLDGKGAEVPAGRRVCGNCIDLAGRQETDYREPDIRVLMGERLAEEGSGKCAASDAFGRANTVTPKPRKWRKQARAVNRSKGRKPKRSNVKHPRPFDDPLPW